MKRNTLKKFSNMAFIQGIDKPRFMVRLLSPYSDYFSKAGLDLSGLGNDNASDLRLLEAFTSSRDSLPPSLLDELYILDSLADEGGHDRILLEAKRSGLDLSGLGAEDLSAGEFAIGVHLLAPQILKVCHALIEGQRVKSFEEYQGRSRAELTLESARATVPLLVAEIAPWFESNHRSRACEIHVFQDGEDLEFQVAHGRLFRTDPNWSKQLTGGRMGWRPQRRDLVVYDGRRSVLKVNAQFSAEREFYRATFGRVLFGDAGHFAENEIYTLEPLLKGKSCLGTVSGIETIRLIHVMIANDNNHGRIETQKGHDLFESAAKDGTPNLHSGRVVRASFEAKYRSGGRSRRIELRPPGTAIYDRGRDEEVTERFLRVNGFLKVAD